MPRIQPDISKNNFNQTSFSGGINTSVPDTELKDDELVDIENLELDKNDNLVVRQGITGVGNGARWDVAHWDQDYWSAQTYTTRITSIHYFQNDNGFVGILYTTGNKLYSRTVNDTITDLTGSLTLPSDTFWQWETFNGIAVGVNKANSGSNPIKVTGPAPGTAAVLGGSPPKAKFIAVWNSRIWLVSATNPNQIQASDLGQAETWNTDGATNASHGFIIDIDTGDGDHITGIHATKERLFVTKREKIYVIRALANPVTDPDNLAVEIFNPDIGCVAGYTLKTVLDDVLGLSQAGIISMAAAQIAGDFITSVLSNKVKDISSVMKNNEEISSLLVTDSSQYWLSIPKELSSTGEDVTYVMDYRRIKEGLIRWMRFNGYAHGTCFASFVDSNGNNSYLIGCVDRSFTPAQYFIGFYTPKISLRTYRDGGLAFRKSFLTKRIDLSKSYIRKLFREWSLGLSVKTDAVSITVNYFLNQSNSASGSYQFNFMKEEDAAVYGTAIYGTSLYGASSGDSEEFIRRAFKRNRKGRKARDVQFEVVNAQLSQGFAIKNFGIEFSPLNSKHTSTA